MTLDELKLHFGNGNIFEIETGISHTQWHYWFKHYNYIPIKSQIKIERLTKGQLLASLNDIPKEDI